METLFDVLYKSDSPKAAAALAALADALVEITLHDPDSMKRTDAARLLTSFHKNEIDPMRLADALTDTYFRVRYYAVQVLGDVDDPAVLNRLAPLLGDIDPMVRQEVLAAFVKHGVGNETIVPELVLLLRDSNPAIRTKSGLMLGLGETHDELFEVLADLLDVGCDMLTLGQYLQPGPKYLPVQRYVPPEEFDALGDIARRMGFQQVASGPFVRSSYHARDMAEATG